MSDLYNKLINVPETLLPLAALLIGLLGSLHCLGMCGPLVLAFSKTKKQNMNYQLGRLFGYLSLAIGLSLLGIAFKLKIQSQLVVDFSVFLLASFMIIYGVMTFLKGKFDFAITKSLSGISERIYLYGQPRLKDSQFFLGGLSIFLPCGLLYGLLGIVLIADSVVISAISVFLFWVGTLPALVIAPVKIRKIAHSFKGRAPTLSSFTFILIGLSTLYFRYQAVAQPGCH